MVQWIPFHHVLLGNEEADTLAKYGNKLLQQHPVSQSKLKTIIKQQYKEAMDSEAQPTI